MDITACVTDEDYEEWRRVRIPVIPYERTQSLAELHGITTQDPQRAQALVMGLMLGDDAKELLREAAAKAGRPYDPQSSLNALAGTASGTGISAFVVDRLKRTFMRKMRLRQGAGFVGRAVRTLDVGHLVVDQARKWGHAVADVFTDRYAFGDDVPASMVEFVYSMLNATPFAVVADFYPAFATLDHFERLEPLGRVPTAVVCGTDDKITSAGHSRKLHSRIPGSSLLECEGAGHMVLLEQHKQVTAELDDLISLARGQALR